MNDFFDQFSWHSSIGISEALGSDKEFVTRLPNTKKAHKVFAFAGSGNNLLIHKTTKALWKVSDDKSYIEPVFPTDILTADQVSEVMGDDEEDEI